MKTKKVEKDSIYLSEVRELVDVVDNNTRLLALTNLMIAEEIKKFRLRLEE